MIGLFFYFSFFLSEIMFFYFMCFRVVSSVLGMVIIVGRIKFFGNDHCLFYRIKLI